MTSILVDQPQEKNTWDSFLLFAETVSDQPQL